MQAQLDARNAAFWDELCGTLLAEELGITDNSPESLRKFDDWYFEYYPYLADHIPFGDMSGKNVLEVGLGYGSVSQRVAESGANYNGLDIAEAPVAMANYRLQLQGLPGNALVGSILAAPFADDTFDYVVAIGCYHHTGDLQRALGESRRLLRPGGWLICMVYNAYSYRRWITTFGSTVQYFLWEAFGVGKAPLASAVQRGAYDLDTEGNEAPHTDFVSSRHLGQLCKSYRYFQASLENIDQAGPFRYRRRTELLKTSWPARCGLDVYFEARK